MKSFRFIIAALIILTGLSSCKVYPPVYKRVENFGVYKIDREGFKVTGNLVFYNPNKFPFRINEMLMNVEVEGKHVATAGQLQPVLINKVSEFSVPLDLLIKPDMTITDAIKTILSVWKARMVNVTLKGTIVVRALGVKIPLTVTDNEKVDISKLR